MIFSLVVWTEIISEVTLAEVPERALFRPRAA
jgi:hypothetical protein